jgi:lysozyme family protein
MADFDEAVEITLGHEGSEYTDDPDDGGGPTRWGIILADLPPGSTAEDVKNLTRDQATSIYRSKYWDPIQGDAIVSQKVANLLFDQGVLNGVSTAVKFVQAIVGAEVDGVFGPETLGKINRTSATKIEALFVASGLRRYVGICENDPSQMKFLKGWVNRSADLLERMFS